MPVYDSDTDTNTIIDIGMILIPKPGISGTLPDTYIKDTKNVETIYNLDTYIPDIRDTYIQVIKDTDTLQPKIIIFKQEIIKIHTYQI